jgi:hypothetical protein
MIARAAAVGLGLLSAVLGVAGAQEPGFDGEDFDVLRTVTGDTLGYGRWRLSFGADTQRLPDGAQAWTVPWARADVALSDWADAGASFDFRAIDGDGDFPSSGWEAGDVWFFLKAMPWTVDGWRLGGALEAKIPSADDGAGVGTDEADLAGRFIAHRRWEEIRLTINAGLAAQGDNGMLHQTDAVFLVGAALEGRLSDRWRLMGELFGSFGGRGGRNLTTGRYADGMVTARAGLVGPLADSGWDWGLAAEAGLTADAPDYFVGLSVSGLMGAREPEAEPEPGARAGRASGPRTLRWINPLETDIAETTAPGEAVAFAFVRTRKQADATQLYNVPRVGAAIPLGPWADLTFWGEFNALDGERGDPVAFSDRSGFGDATAKLKLVPLRGDEFHGGLVVGGKLPLSSHGGLTTGESDVFAKLIGSFFWDDVRLHLNAGLVVEGDPTATSTQNDYVTYSAALEWLADECVTVLAELAGSTASEKLPNYGFGSNGDNRLEAALGLLGPLSDDWTWTFVGSKGLTDDSPDWELSAGFSYLFGD